MTLKVGVNPLELFLGWEWSVFVEWKCEGLIGAKAQRATHIIHLLVGWVIVHEGSQSTIVVFVLRSKIVPNELALLLDWDVLVEAFDSLEQFTFVKPLNVCHRDKADSVQVLHEFWNYLSFRQAHIDRFEFYHVIRVDY